MPHPSIGLYIGTQSVDLVSLTGSFKQPRLLSLGRVRVSPLGGWRQQIRAEEEISPAAPGAPPPQSPQSPSELIRSIQMLLTKASVAPRSRCFISITSESLVIRYFQMPTVPARERKVAIPFEAKKYLPFKLEELLTDSQIVVRPGDPTLMRVMFFGIKRSSLETLLSVLKDSEVLPICLEPAPLSLMRLLTQNGQLSPKEVVVLLSMEEETATINIASNELLYLSRNVSALTPATASGFPQELWEALVNETRVSIDYYRRRFLGEPPVAKVVLFRGERNPKAIDELKEALELPVEWGEPFRRMTWGKEVSLGISVATGLALRGLEKRPTLVNLLPPGRREQPQTILKPALAELAAAFAILFLWWSLTQRDLNQLKQEIQSLAQRKAFPTGVSVSATTPELKKIQSGQGEKIRLLEKISQLRPNQSALLSEVSRLLPPEAWLEEFRVEETSQADASKGPIRITQSQFVQLIGKVKAGTQAEELQKINEFLASVKSSHIFGSRYREFQLDSVRRTVFQEETVTEFQLTCAPTTEDLRMVGGLARRREGG